MHMNLSTPYTHSPVAGAGLSLSGDTWSLSATAGASTGDFIQYDGSDWVNFDLFGTANTWSELQSFDPVAGIDIAGGVLLLDGATTLIQSSLGDIEYVIASGKKHSFIIDGTVEFAIAANLATFNQATTNSTISWVGATGIVFDGGVAGWDFRIASSSEVLIEADTLTLNQATLAWIFDWSTDAVLTIGWNSTGLSIVPTIVGPITDNATSSGSIALGWSDAYTADNGGWNMRGGVTHRIRSDAENEVEIVAPNIVNTAIGSTDQFRVDAAGVQVLGSTTAPANAGEVHYLTDDKALKFAAAHGAAGFMGLVAQTSAAEAEIGASSTSEADFATTKAFGADDLTAGYIIPIRFAGLMDSASNSVATVRIELHGAGETTILSFVTASGNVSADDWYLEAVVHVATVGATGTVAASGRLFAKSVLLISTTPSVTIDTTEALTLAVSVQFDKSNAGNGMTAHTASFQAGQV